MRYEDLLNDPNGTVSDVLEFLGLPDAGAFRERLRRYTFSTGRAAAFERDLDPASLKALEDTVGPTLARYGYQ